MLVAVGESLCKPLSDGIAEAPDGAGAMAAVAAGFERASTMMGPDKREFDPRIRAAVATSTNCSNATRQRRAWLRPRWLHQGRAAFPRRPRTWPGLGVLALKQGYARWSEDDQHDGRELAEYALAALDERTASRALD